MNLESIDVGIIEPMLLFDITHSRYLVKFGLTLSKEGQLNTKY